jgi:hypothetical protein
MRKSKTLSTGICLLMTLFFVKISNGQSSYLKKGESGIEISGAGILIQDRAIFASQIGYSIKGKLDLAGFYSFSNSPNTIQAGGAGLQVFLGRQSEQSPTALAVNLNYQTGAYGHSRGQLLGFGIDVIKKIDWGESAFLLFDAAIAYGYQMNNIRESPLSGPTIGCAVAFSQTIDSVIIAIEPQFANDILNKTIGIGIGLNIIFF